MNTYVKEAQAYRQLTRLVNDEDPYIRRPPRDPQDDQTIDLAALLRTLLEYRWTILATAVLTTLLGIAYVFVARPIYEANILIQVKDNMSEPRNAVADLAGGLERKTSVATEMEVLRSRNILSRVVNSTQSYISVVPKYVPVVGPWLASFGESVSNPGIAGLNTGHVWGRESADLAVFQVPEALKGKVFTMTVLADGRVRIRQVEEGINFTAVVGSVVTQATRLGTIEMRVARVVAKPGAQFFLTHKQEAEAVEQLAKSLKINEKGKQSNIIDVRLAGRDPKEITRVVNEVGREYIRQTGENKAAEAEKSLEFLNRQLPVLKKDLEAAEELYNKVRNSNSTVDLAEESKAIVQRSTALQTKLFELTQKREEMRIRYTDTHPAVEGISTQIRQVDAEIQAVNGKIKRMPAIEQSVLRATRDMKVNTELYTNLLSTAQQLRQVSASRLAAAHLLDTAVVPVKPTAPNRKAVVSIAALLGLILGAALAIVKKKMSGELLNPHTLINDFRIPVTAIIPHSPQQKRLNARIGDNSTERAVSVLPYVAPEDSAVESLRGFRTLLLQLAASRSNSIVLITGPTAEVGKSFVSANSAAVLASINKRVLLIDGDMRKGHLHRYFGVERENGLSELLMDECGFDQAIHRNVVENVDFIATGKLPPQPAELLAHPNFRDLLHELSEQYDFILLDTAPALAFTDAAIIATHAEAIYIVVRDKVTTEEEIEETIRRLAMTGRRINGTIYNDLKRRSAYRYGYGSRAGYQQYE